MVQINVDVPKLEVNSITPSAIRDFRRKARVFSAQNENFPLALLLDDELQHELEDSLQRDLETVTEEELFAFLTRQSLPTSLLELRDALDAVKCPLTAHDGHQTRAAAVRQFVGEFKEWADLSQEVASAEIAADIAALLPEVTEEVAFLTEDKKAEVKTITRKPTTTEAAAVRATAFEAVARKVFMRKLKPKAFFRRVELEKDLLKPKTLKELIALTKAVARHEDQRGPSLDVPIPSKPVPAQTPAQTTTTTVPAVSTGQQSAPQTIRTLATRNRPCKHCNGAHWDSDCPTRTTQYNRSNGTLRPNPPRVKQEANSAEVEDDTAVLETTVEIKGKQYPMIIDTGAGRSFMSQGTAQTLHRELKKLTVKPFQVVTADGKTSTCDGVASVEMTLPSVSLAPVRFTQTFYILPGSAHKILLGCGALRRLGFLSEKKLVMEFDHSERAGTDEIVLPHHHKYLSAELNNISSGEEDYRSVHIPDSKAAGDLRSLVEDYQDVFDPVLPKEGSRLDAMTVELRDPEKVVAQKVRPLNHAKKALVAGELERLHDQGFVRPSKGPFSAPIVIVGGGHKGSNKIRLCVDYKGLNAETVPDSYPLPDVRTFVSEAAGCSYFAALDLRQGYYQMRMAPEDVPKTAFITPDAYLEWLVCPFGLRNAPARFMRAMHKAFAEPLRKGGVAIYIDDIFVYGKDEEEFKARLKSVLETCRQYNLRLKAPKCHIGAEEVEMVGFICSKKGQRVTKGRIEGIQAMNHSRSVKDLQRTLGAFQYLTRFVPDSARILAPLNALCRKDSDLQWTDEHTKAMDAFKAAVAKNIALAHPDVNKPWRLETDASNAGLGGLLLQKEGDNWQIISCFAKTFTSTESRWPTYEQELFAVLHCLSRPDLSPLFRIHQNLTIRTDHRNLIYLMNRKDLSKKLLRWTMLLSDYNYTIEHVPGEENVMADTLSRMESANAVTDTNEAINWPDKIKEAQQNAKEAEKASWARSSLIHMQNGLWKREMMLVVPEGPLRPKILAHAHRFHGGEHQTLAFAKEIGWWPGLAADTIASVRSCPLCLKTRLRAFRRSQVGTTMASDTWEVVAVDTIGPLKADDKGMKYITVMTDVFSRYTEVVPTAENTAESAASALLQLCLRHGVPLRVRSDNGPEFANRVIAELVRRLGSLHQRTLPYHPESNGVVERLNAEVMRHVRWLALDLDKRGDWSSLLPLVQHIVNNTTHSATGFTPNEVVYGRNQRLGSKAQDMAEPAEREPLRSHAEYIAELKQLQTTWQATAIAEQQARLTQRQAGQEAVPDRIINPGDLVLMKRVVREKLQGLEGPWKVRAVRKNKALELESLLDQTTKIVHQDRVMDFPVRDPDLTTLRRWVAGDHDEYVVVGIRDHDEESRQLLVDWEGYEEPTWEPLAAVKHLTCAKEYVARHKIKWPLRSSRQ